METSAWGTGPWLEVVTNWATESLLAHGATVVGHPVEHVTQPWSTVWTIHTNLGRFWFKQNHHAATAEGEALALVAAVAPRYVEAPVAVDARRGWLLTADGGSTVMDAAPGSRGVESGTLKALLRDYARMQRATVGHWDDFAQTGVRTAHPRDAADTARRQAHQMAAMPECDPRHLTNDQHQTVLDALPALAEAGTILASGPVPLALDHGDLFPRNVFVPRAGGQPFRFFDFAEALWAHPFGSLVMFIWEGVHRWSIPQPPDRIECRDSRVREIFDAYLECWTDLAPLDDLRAIAEHALRIAPLHRSEVWLQVLDGADDAALEQHGGTPWAWLQDVAKPVLL